MFINRMPSYKRVNPLTGTTALRSLLPANKEGSRRASVASTASTTSTASNTPTLSNYDVTGVNNNNNNGSRRSSILSSASIEYGNVSNVVSVGSVGSGASSSSFHREEVPRSGSVSSTERALSTRMHASSTGVEHAKHSSALRATPKQSLRMLTAKNFAGLGQVSPAVQSSLVSSSSAPSSSAPSSSAPSSSAPSSSAPSSSAASAPYTRNKSRNPFTNAPKNKKNNSAFTMTNPMKKRKSKTRKLRRVSS